MKQKQTKKKKIGPPGELWLEDSDGDKLNIWVCDGRNLLEISDNINCIPYRITKSEAKQIGEWFLKLSEALEE